MRLNIFETRARKAWFFDGDLMVALGAEISSSSSSAVATTLNQTRLLGGVMTDSGALKGAAAAKLADVKWVWHNGITYLFPLGGNVSLRHGELTGEGQRINTARAVVYAKADVMALTLEHGIRPSAASYAYGVWMGASAPKLAGAAPAFAILSNSKSQQAVRFGQSGLVQAVLHEPEVVDLGDGWTLRSDQPCLLQARRNGSQWQVTVADPTTRLRSVRLALSNAGKAMGERKVLLPSDPADLGRGVDAKLGTPR